jgi:hypothetical protein
MRLRRRHLEGLPPLLLLLERRQAVLPCRQHLGVAKSCPEQQQPSVAGGTSGGPAGGWAGGAGEAGGGAAAG